MDDFKIWFYILLGVIYLLSRLLKKKEKPEESQQGEFENPYGGQKTTSTAEGERPLTFDELLKEITEAKRQAQRPYTAPQTQARTTGRVDYDEDLKDEAADLEDEDYDYKKRNNVYEVYENAKKQAFLRPSLEESLKLADTDMKFGKFKEFDTESKKVDLNEYLKEFRDPEGLKKAVVMSEILQRRF